VSGNNDLITHFGARVRIYLDWEPTYVQVASPSNHSSSQENEKGSKREFGIGCYPMWLNNAKGIDNIEEYRTRLRYHIPSFEFVFEFVVIYITKSNYKTEKLRITKQRQ
jgi:hypothetical protein